MTAERTGQAGGAGLEFGIVRLQQLEEFLPDQHQSLYEYANFLAGRLKPGTIPADFAATSLQAAYDLSRGIDGRTGEVLDHPLVGLPIAEYNVFLELTSKLAHIAYPKDYAKGVDEFLVFVAGQNK